MDRANRSSGVFIVLNSILPSPWSRSSVLNQRTDQRSRGRTAARRRHPAAVGADDTPDTADTFRTGGVSEATGPALSDIDSSVDGLPMRCPDKSRVRIDA